jgi:aldehyde dehydrogenase (NAD+)
LCIDYAIVPESLCHRFVEGVAEKLKAMYYPNATYNKDANSRIVDARNFQRVKAYIDDAVARGATLAFGGGVDEKNLIIEPTILLDVPPDALIMKHEIFGPVLPVVTYRDKDDAVAIVNARPKPLGMYIYSDDNTFVEYILARTSSGGVTVNGWAAHYFELGLPFGGVNHSGHGSYHGIHGFRELSHARSVYQVM